MAKKNTNNNDKIMIILLTILTNNNKTHDIKRLKPTFYKSLVENDSPVEIIFFFLPQL